MRVELLVSRTGMPSVLQTWGRTLGATYVLSHTGICLCRVLWDLEDALCRAHVLEGCAFVCRSSSLQVIKAVHSLGGHVLSRSSLNSHLFEPLKAENWRQPSCCSLD